MSTHAKKHTQWDRCVIADLSWPPQGNSVNSRIPKDEYMGNSVKITYPTIDRLCKHAVEVGSIVVGYKKDMQQAFKQIILDPLSWSYLGISWEGGSCSKKLW